MRSRQPVVMFAGGIGITPFLAYLESLARISAEKRPEVWLFYVNRDGAAHAFKRRIAALRETWPALYVFDCYRHPRPGVDVKGSTTTARAVSMRSSSATSSPPACALLSVRVRTDDEIHHRRSCRARRARVPHLQGSVPLAGATARRCVAVVHRDIRALGQDRAVDAATRQLAELRRRHWCGIA